MKILKFNILFELDEDGYFVASVPALPGCYTQGKTLEEARRRIEEAIKLCLKDDSDYSDYPQPSFVGIDSVTIKYA